MRLLSYSCQELNSANNFNELDSELWFSEGTTVLTNKLTSAWRDTEQKIQLIPSWTSEMINLCCLSCKMCGNLLRTVTVHESTNTYF